MGNSHEEQLGMEINGSPTPDIELRRENPSNISRALVSMHRAWAELVTVTGDLPELVAATIVSKVMGYILWLMIVGPPSSGKTEAAMGAKTISPSDISILPKPPATTYCIPSHAIELSLSSVPGVCAAHVTPSRLVSMVPAAPLATY